MTIDELAKVIADNPGLSVEFSGDSGSGAVVLDARRNLPDGRCYADSRRVAREAMQMWAASAVAMELDRLLQSMLNPPAPR